MSGYLYCSFPHASYLCLFVLHMTGQISLLLQDQWGITYLPESSDSSCCAHHIPYHLCANAYHIQVLLLPYNLSPVKHKHLEASESWLSPRTHDNSRPNTSHHNLILNELLLTDTLSGKWFQPFSFKYTCWDNFPVFLMQNLNHKSPGSSLKFEL